MSNRFDLEQVSIRRGILGTLLQIVLLAYSFFAYLVPKNIAYGAVVGVALLLVVYTVLFRDSIRFSQAALRQIFFLLAFVVLCLFPVVIGLFDGAGTRAALLMVTILTISILFYTFQPDASKLGIIMLAFSSVHVFFTLFSFAFTAIFRKSVLAFMPPQVVEMSNFFLIRNVYNGIADQTGRNSVYITIGIAVLFAAMLAKDKFKSVRRWILLLIFMAALFLTGKRGTLVAVIAPILILIVLDSRKRGRKLAQTMTLALASLLVIFILLPYVVPSTAIVLNRFFVPTGVDITSGRGPLFRHAFSLFSQKPIFGWGYGTFGSMSELSAHNMYIQLLADCGLVGTLFLMSIFTLNLRKVLKVIRLQVSAGTSSAFAPYLSLFIQIFFLIYGLTDSGFYNTFTLVIYLIAAVFPFQMEVFSPINADRPRTGAIVTRPAHWVFRTFF